MAGYLSCSQRSRAPPSVVGPRPGCTLKDVANTNTNTSRSLGYFRRSRFMRSSLVVVMPWLSGPDLPNISYGWTGCLRLEFSPVDRYPQVKDLIASASPLAYTVEYGLMGSVQRRSASTFLLEELTFVEFLGLFQGWYFLLVPARELDRVVGGWHRSGPRWHSSKLQNGWLKWLTLDLPLVQALT